MMARCKSVQEVRGDLCSQLSKSTACVRLAMETWMQAVDHLLPHMEQQKTAAATQLVQAALQDTPQIISRGEHEQYLWLEKHLPGISAAMQACTRSQLDITNKRISILQSLPSLSAKQEGLEVHAWVLTQIMVWVFFVLLPVATLIDVLHYVHGHASHPGMSRQRQLRASMQQGRALLEMAGMKFEQLRHVAWPMQDTLLRLSTTTSMCTVGLSMPGAPVVLAEMAHNLAQSVIAACRWLVGVGTSFMPLQACVSILAHSSRGVVTALCTLGILSYGCLDHESLLDCIRPAMCQLLKHSELRAQLTRLLSAEYLRQMLLTIKLTATHLQDAGMTPAQQQQVLTEMELGVQRESQSDPILVATIQALQRMIAASVGRASTSGAEQAPASNVSGVEGNDADDMQALLRQMYG